MFALSLAVPAVVVVEKPLFGGSSHDQILFGFHCLVFGFFVWPGWIANPLLVASWFVHANAWRRPRHLRVATWLALAALPSALLAPFLLDLRYPHVGYFLWVACIAASALDSHLARLDAIERDVPNELPRQTP